MRNFFREVITFALGDLGGGLLKDILRGDASNEGVILERFRSTFKGEPRVDLAQTLMAISSQDSEIILARHRKAREKGTGNTFLDSLCKLLPKNEDGSVDLERAKTTLSQLARMDESLFDQLIISVKRDPISESLELLTNKFERYNEEQRKKIEERNKSWLKKLWWNINPF